MSVTQRIRAAAAAVLTALVAACAASFDGHNLKPDVATTADVVATMGEPALSLKQPGGDTLLYYPRYQTGPAMFVARMSGDGKLRSIEQRLSWNSVRAIRPGMYAEEVRALLGPPFEVTRWPRQQRDVWEYPYRHAVRERRVTYVMFSYDGVVRDTFDMHDDARDPENDWGR